MTSLTLFPLLIQYFLKKRGTPIRVPLSAMVVRLKGLVAENKG